MIVPAVITTLLCSSLGLEFRVAITLPGWLDWVHGILLIALLWLSMGLWVWALALLSLPADARRGIAIARFAKERGLRYSRHGLAPARHIMIDARGKGSLRSLLPGTQHL